MVGRTRTRTRSGSAVVVAGQLFSAGAVCPVVIRAGRRAQVVVCGQDELSRLVGGQLWMVLHEARGYLRTRQLLNPQSPAHAVAVFQDRRIRSGDARRPYGAQEVRRQAAPAGAARPMEMTAPTAPTRTFPITRDPLFVRRLLSVFTIVDVLDTWA